MATSFETAAESELACGVCFQFFVKPHEPKNLPKCSHILCQICLQKMTKGRRKTVKCPQCNKVSPLPEEGIEGLTTTLAMRNLAERHPEGIKQYKEYMHSKLQCGQEKTANEAVKLKELIKQTQDAIKIEEQEIEKAVEAVMIKAEELVKQLRNTSGLDHLHEQLAKLETEMKCIEKTQHNLKTITNKEFHAQTDAITNQIEKLKIDRVKETTNPPCVGKFAANIQLGRIVKPRQLELVQEFGEFEVTSGIASNSSGVLAVSDMDSEPKQVSVFQKNSTGYKLQSKFPVHLPGSEDAPSDIAISEERNYLVTKCTAGFDVYSADGKFQKIESVTDQQSQQRKMDVVSNSICNTKDGRILVGSEVRAEDQESGEFVVTVHDKGGSLVKTIPVNILPTGITDINGTHVAVCDFTVCHKVCAYDLQTGKETLNIDVQEPCGICYDEQSDCLLIGRMTKTDKDGDPVDGSGVIEQYCRMSGKLVACLAHGLQGPFGLAITEDNMLAITDEKTVKLYKIY